ncbi:MAG TPA: T9SS type A sorting domain-containing protein [Flavobacterium sp.]|nr:T9SS type A sorting domain-containing protein [Flavobacterium sp.]
MKKQLLIGAMLMGAFFTANAQNSCAEAIELAVGTTTVGDIDGEFDGACWQNPGTGAEWYTITADANGVYRINTNLPANADGDTRISVYVGDCNELECYAGSDDVYYAQNDPENIYLTDFVFPVEEGTTYYVAFDDVWSDAGFDVEVSFSTADCSANALNEDWSNAANWYFGCWGVEDANENAGTADATTWVYADTNNVDSDDLNADPIVIIFADADGAKDDTLMSHEFNLVAGTEYTFNITYNAINVQDAEQNVIPADESFEVLILGADDFMEEIGSEENVAMSGTNLTELTDNAIIGSYTFTPAADGMYSLAIHASAGPGVLAIFEITAEGGNLSTNDILASKFTVYPNPANNVINIANAENILVNGVVITDLNGRTVKNVSYNGVTEAQINVSDLASGMYMMTVSSDKGTMTKKIVKN